MRKAGYTLIELAVVVFLIGIMLFLAAPRLRNTVLDDSLKTAVRHLTGTAKELRNEALRNQVDHVLLMDLNDRVVWTETVDMTPEKRAERRKGAFRLPEGIRIGDVSRIGKKKQYEGEATIHFFKKGYMQPTVVHLAQGERFFTLVFQPFASSVKTYEEYVDFDPMNRPLETVHGSPARPVVSTP